MSMTMARRVNMTPTLPAPNTNRPCLLSPVWMFARIWAAAWDPRFSMAFHGSRRNRRTRNLSRFGQMSDIYGHDLEREISLGWDKVIHGFICVFRIFVDHSAYQGGDTPGPSTCAVVASYEMMRK